MKIVQPSVSLTAFNCPHCGALAKQFWFDAHASGKIEKSPLPNIVDDDTFDKLSNGDFDDENTKKRVIRWAGRMRSERPFLNDESASVYNALTAHNVSFSRCFNCKELSVWIYDRLVFPRHGEAPPPNPDLPDEIKRDYLEGSAILSASPRGAAALARLVIQKICIHLGMPGENINSDIKGLVANGLDVRIQKALDAVRVVGNNAVHPGQMDLRDNRDMAENLFRLINLVAEKTISEPKQVDEFYDQLPDTLRKAIAARDGKSDPKS